MFPNATDVWFGSRCPHPLFDKYRDSNTRWAQETATAVGFKRVHTPCAMRTKRWVRGVVHGAGIPDAAIFSSEGWNYGMTA